MLVVWGVVFILTGLRESSDSRLSFVWWGFALEKCCYIHANYKWLLHNEPVLMFQAAQKSRDPLDLLPVIFHTIYGAVDFLALLLFLNLGVRALFQGPSKEAQDRKNQ